MVEQVATLCLLPQGVKRDAAALGGDEAVGVLSDRLGAEVYSLLPVLCLSSLADRGQLEAVLCLLPGTATEHCQ